MTEEEQIEAAIQESLRKGSKTPSQENKSYGDSRSENNLFKPQIRQTLPPTVSNISSQNILDNNEKFVKREEPSSTEPGATLIQFRLPDGRKIVRRFLVGDPVSYLFDFLRAELPFLRDRPLEVRNQSSTFLYMDSRNLIASFLSP
jgi:UBX domain-containing protein 7